MKALASPPVIAKLFIVVAVARFIVPFVSFFRVSTQNCFKTGMCETGVFASLEAGCSP